MTNIYSIYCITNLVNNKKYIGFTSKNPPEKRFIKHIKDCKNRNKIFHNAINKHGVDNFIFEVICQSKDKDYMLTIMEEYFIRLYNSHYLDGHGYNMTYGGCGCSENYKHSDETRKKMSESAKRYYKNNPRKIVTQETRDKLSIANKGKLIPQETRDKIRKSVEWQMGTYEITFEDNRTEIIKGLKTFSEARGYSRETLTAMMRLKNTSKHKDIISIKRLY